MSGRTLRALRTTALVAVVTVVTVGATDLGPGALADPASRAAEAGGTPGGRVSAAPGPPADRDGAGSGAAVPLPGAPGSALRAPGGAARAPRKPALGPVAGAVPARVSRALTRLQGLFRQAAEASEAYDATRDVLAGRAAETRRLSTALADARSALARSRDEAGRLARRQYQGRTELSPYLGLLLARDPRSALDQGRLLERAADGSRAVITRMERRTRRADALAAAARRAFEEQRALAERQREQRDTLRGRLDDVEEVLASLSPEELAALTALGPAAPAPAPVAPVAPVAPAPPYP
ncbi:coiled-coil domain-containing protein [Streptomyces tirandamycinicus]|uniref:NlpC/P60 family protein n=1 Tax=Streptomyces tirandamycinicus TaxID=2174846 RepID=A0A2S1SWY8_9ACTN|nr:hypothetical protein [Streptomyces tirandamycinicus]AWI30934.1 hypothetical protein DDW44_20760 [Streptomyces tirandamycinicus]